MKLITECNCNLCCEGSLPGVGSHLFSEFLIKETVNRDGKASAKGKNSKGNELLFTLTPLESAEIFIGRQSTEEALKVLGKDKFSNEEVENLQSQEVDLIDSNLVCSRCEKLFQSVEDNFKVVYDDILKKLDEDPVDYSIDGSHKVSFELFLNMNIWRASMSDKFNLFLDDSVQTCLTELMYKVFIEDIDNTNYNEKFEKEKATYNCLSIITFFDKTPITDPDKINENFIFSFNSTNPYFLAINRLLLCISANDFDGIGVPAICNGVIDDLLKYLPESNDKVFFISRERMIDLGKNYAKLYVGEFNKHLIETYSIGFDKLLGRKPSQEEIQELISETKKHIGEFYDPKVSDKKIFSIMAKLINTKIRS